jgi:hypothetical protein
MSALCSYRVFVVSILFFSNLQKGRSYSCGRREILAGFAPGNSRRPLYNFFSTTRVRSSASEAVSRNWITEP